MYQPRLGDPLEMLDTPSMLVDLTLMEANIASLMGHFRAKHVHVRPHLKTVKSPELAHILLAAGAVGGCVAKVSEAEVMAQAGIEDLLITSEIVGKPKLARLVALQQQHPHIKVVVDSLTGAEQLNQAMHLLTSTAAQLLAEGFAIAIVTTGGTGTAEICASCDGVTEVQPGSFIFMDTDYRNALGPVYSNALTILSTVISRPAPNRAVVDAGLKSLSIDSGMPEPKGLAGVKYRPGGDEHGILTWDESVEPANIKLEVGDRIEFIPSHIDTTINLHDYYYAYRNGKLEAIWPVSARGKVQ